jgi:Flp pilus assembly protein TadB
VAGFELIGDTNPSPAEIRPQNRRAEWLAFRFCPFYSAAHAFGQCLAKDMTTKKETATDGSAASANRAIGAMFFALFGGCWLAFGLLGGYGMRLAPLLGIVAGTLLLFFASRREFRRNRGAHAAEAESPESKRTGRIFITVNVIQWTLVFIVATVLSKLGHKEWVIPSIIFIVGVHFFPLALAFKVPRHYATGAAMTLLAVFYPFISSAGPGSPVGCLGAGIILWASAVAALASPA